MDLHNNPSDARAYTRRLFLQQGLGSLAFASAALSVPGFLQRSALALPMAQQGLSSIPGVNQGRVLVVIQLGGGNDGLNTLAPVGVDAYHNARPNISIRAEQALELARGNVLGLHPALEGVKSLWDDGLCSIVQGVGYPNPNRSHFKSMDIWHTADTTGKGTGWISRYVDSQCCGFGKGESGRAEDETIGQPTIAIGRTAPLAMEGGQIKPVAFETEDLFRWTGREIHESLGKPYDAIVTRDPGADAPSSPSASFLMRTAMDAQVSSQRIRDAVSARPLVNYPRTGLARQLSMIASMIRADMDTRVYYATLGGFDTHAGQGGAQGQHANLLRQFGDAVRAFYNDLQEQGNQERVLTMCFSEFGRRVGQNASGGTDHGTAAPMFMFGPMVKPGLAGTHPSLTDLDNGDLKYTTDFRNVYANVLGDWLKADSNTVLEGRFRGLDLLKV